MRRYWIGVVSQDHAVRAVAGGFVQLNHGKAAPLERMRPGDGFAFYSPRTRQLGGETLQAFTAIGQVPDAPLERADGPGGEPCFRRPMAFRMATVAPIRPLIESLSFIHSKKHWGAAFRFGFLPVPEEDFARIATAMGRNFREDFAGEAHPSASGPATTGVSLP